MKKLLALLVAAGLSSAAFAQMTDAEVQKVDKTAGKVTLKHGEIKNLNMPPMTMVFTAKDKALLAQVKKGDKVRFSAEQTGGNYIVTAIEPSK